MDGRIYLRGGRVALELFLLISSSCLAAHPSINCLTDTISSVFPFLRRISCWSKSSQSPQLLLPHRNAPIWPGTQINWPLLKPPGEMFRQWVTFLMHEIYPNIWPRFNISESEAWVWSQFTVDLSYSFSVRWFLWVSSGSGITLKLMDHAFVYLIYIELLTCLWNGVSRCGLF